MIFDPYFTTKQTGRTRADDSLLDRQETQRPHSVSSKRRGAVFTVYLPASTADGRLIMSAAGLLNGSGRILVMDDEEAFGALVELLREAGGRAACDGRGHRLMLEALKQGRPYDAVIMDLTVRRPGRKGDDPPPQSTDQNVRAIASTAIRTIRSWLITQAGLRRSW